MSGDRNRFSRSKSPKPRWHEENSENEAVNNNGTKEEAASTEDANVPKSDSDSNVALNTQASVEQVEHSNSEVSLNASISEDGAPKVQRKRKWLNNEAAAANLLSSKKSLTISSDTLKNVLPTPLPQTKEENNEQNNVSEELASSNETTNANVGSSSNNDPKRKFIESNDSNANENSEQPTVVRQQSSRTVILEVSVLFGLIY
jgi:hypothetical protein